MSTYMTTYCNFPHRLADGKPVEHECYVLPPASLQAEREGRYQDAIALIEAAKPMRLMRRGVKVPTTNVLARYTLEGRTISDNGKEIITITREVDTLNLSHISPTNCDRLAKHIVQLLNAKPLPDK